jgi:hypothetical protein
MKKSALCLCFTILAAAWSLGACAPTKNSSAQILDETATLWKTALQSGDNCSKCIARCADDRDRCRASACAIIGAHSNTPQACSTPTNDTPQTHQQFVNALKACFDQEKTCDAQCPCK